jgi:heterodisulfide reductase subunit C
MNRETIYPDYHFAEELLEGGPFQTEACFQCRKCTNGCPVSFAMDLFPDEVVRLVLLGQKEKVLNCKTIWICAACETCTTRCPNEVRIAELMDHLKEMAIKENVPCPVPQVLTLHETFLNNVKKRGRVFETTLLPAYLLKSGRIPRKLKDGTWLEEARLGWKMFFKGRMPFFQKKIRGKKDVKGLFKTLKK